MFRSVTLPEGVSGHLYLYSMPGLYEVFDTVQNAIARQNITCVVSLAPLNEIRRKSPAYAQAIEAGRLLWVQVVFPVANWGVPGNWSAFWELAQRVANRLRAGEGVLIHGDAGVGRTGTLAICVLMALGLARKQACGSVWVAGSRPETSAQETLVRWVAETHLSPF
jgi:protein-tyrosine phosphatase